MILIGSKAIETYFPDFHRKSKDTDYATNEIISSEKRSEYKRNHNVELLYNPILDHAKDILSKDELCTLKASHLCWDINWSKHMFDLQFLLKKGCKIDHKLFFSLYNFWNDHHSKNKRSDLKMSKENFFTNGINYNAMEHDELHKIINLIPTYTKTLKDGAEVELDELKFNSLSNEDKINFVREEVYVMAYERYRKENYHVAYSKMLKKFIISHAPLFSLIFIFENYMSLYKPTYDFISYINKHLELNTVKIK